jgi:hypothetical protein
MIIHEDMNLRVGYIINESAIPGFTETNIIREDKEGRVIAEADLQTADELNRNGRIYPSTELFPQLTCQRTRELLESGYFRGEMGHPLSNELVRQQTIDDTRTCVQFLKLWTEGSVVKGRYRGTNNAFGKAINEDLKDGCKPAFSLRALGTIQKTPRGNEVHNLKIITYDCVIYPSHPGAYTHGIVNESADISDNNTKKTHLQLVAESMNINYYDDILKPSDQDKFTKFTDQDVISYIKSESANFKYIKENFDFIYDDITLDKNSNHVILHTNEGATLVINLEKHIQNEIMDYCSVQSNLRKL